MLSDQEETGQFPGELPLHPAGSRARDGASARLFLGAPATALRWLYEPETPSESSPVMEWPSKIRGTTWLGS